MHFHDGTGQEFRAQNGRQKQHTNKQKLPEHTRQRDLGECTLERPGRLDRTLGDAARARRADCHRWEHKDQRWQTPVRVMNGLQ